MSVRKIIEQARQEMTDYSASEAEQLIYILLNDMFNISRTKLIAYPDTKLSKSDYNQINKAIKRLKNNEPVQYIVGFAEFFDRQFRVNPAVLIPRPETEELVAWMIKEHQYSTPSILDIGTGSGCIAISLAAEISGARLSAIDVSAEALSVAVENARVNKVNIDFIHASILDSSTINKIPDDLDIIVSNPPYVTQKQKQIMHKNVVDNEPHLALFVQDHDPLVFYRQIAIIAQKKLKKGASLYFEINEEYGDETKVLLAELGYDDIILRKDINGKDRMLKALK